jgi:hypothetical protein
MLRATSKIGEQLVLDHLGSLRRVTIVAISKGRGCFEWTGKTAGTTRRT